MLAINTEGYKRGMMARLDIRKAEFEDRASKKG
jgi:hypothetical protein